jgi:hypothetical protein
LEILASDIGDLNPDLEPPRSKEPLKMSFITILYRTKPLVPLIIFVLGLAIVASAHPNQPSNLSSPGWGIEDDSVYGSKISMVASNDGWIVSFSGKSANLYRWDGASWTDEGNVSHAQDIVRGDIAMVSSSDGWLVLGGPLGQSASSVIYRWDGSDWNYHSTITDPNEVSFSALDVISASNVWAVGGSAFGSNYYRWNGSNWQLNARIWLPLIADNDIDMVSASDGWAVGFTGNITRWNGSKWNEVSSPVTTSLNAISMVSANDGWAVGGSWSEPAVIVRWNGSNWLKVTSPVTSKLNDISMVSASDGWAVGNDGVILHWNGSSWQQVASPTLSTLNAVEMITATDGKITGSGGTMRLYDPSLAINYSSGAPGSYFTLNGTDFPPDTTATITINGQSIGNMPTDAVGEFEFFLSTSSAEEGVYYITASVNPSATARLTLASDVPVRPQDGTGTIFDVPAGIAYTEIVYLPAVLR